MRLPSKPLRVALVQFSAGGDAAANMDRIERLLRRVRSADLIVLPEVFALRGGHREYRCAAEPVGGPLTQWLAGVARRRRAWVMGGSIIERAPGGPYNTAVLVDRTGRVAATYRKIHLFEARLESGQVIRERQTYRAGAAPVMATVGGWRCGLAVCYDLRFPELFRYYSAHGAHVLLAPSNFTQRTGKDHWETLVRARAIENQCFVAAPNQHGANPVTGVRSHGHSLAVGPWGEVLCEGGTRDAVLTATFESAALRETRRRVPALGHRRM